MKKNNFRKSFITISAAVAVVLLAVTGCSSVSDASKAGENLSIAADNFEVQRHIVGINGITDKHAFEVLGRCSINDQGKQLEVICKHGPDDYKKHMVGLSDNVFYVSEQLDAIDVSVYHTRVIIKPENLLPELELSIGRQ